MNGTRNFSPASAMATSAVLASMPPAHVFPTLPKFHNFSVLGNPAKFHKYVHRQLPLALLADEVPMSSPPPSPTLQSQSERLCRSVNGAYINSPPKGPEKTIMGDLQWVSEDMFPDAKLPVPFS